MDPLGWLAGIAGWKGLKAVPGLATWAESHLDRKRRQSILRDLNTLAFWNEGLLDPISAIAEGRGEARHCEQIKTAHARTKAEVNEAATRLIAVRN